VQQTFVPAASFENAVMEDGVPNEGVGIRHQLRILGRCTAASQRRETEEKQIAA
jgi:hypothetical protein